MRVAVIGSGPAGLYFAYLLKRSFPNASIDIFEQNPAHVTWGFGVVFSDQALGFLTEDDPETLDYITPWMEAWKDLTLDLMGERVLIDGIGFAAIGRLKLLQLLHDRASSVGLSPRFHTRVDDLSVFDSHDLVVGADGQNSVVRLNIPDGFGTTIRHLRNKFIWYGTSKIFETLTQSFRMSEWGPFNAHHYRYSENMSTFIIETDAETWERTGFENMPAEETRKECERIFSDVLGGLPLVSNHSKWRNFPRLWNKKWWHSNAVLLGDALHTAHFSIGSGTRLAMEDAIALVKSMNLKPDDIPAALQSYQDSRRPVVEKLMSAADASSQWYENFGEHMKLPPWEFAYSYIRRAGRLEDKQLHALSPGFMARYKTFRSKGTG